MALCSPMCSKHTTAVGFSVLIRATVDWILELHSLLFPSFRKELVLTNPLDTLETWDVSTSQPPCISQFPYPPLAYCRSVLLLKESSPQEYYSNSLFSVMSIYLD